MNISLGYMYYVPYIGDGIVDYEYHHWLNNWHDIDRYDAGLVYLTKEEAEYKAKCILKFLQDNK